MEFQQYFSQECESIPNRSTESAKKSPCFDCSICLDFARDPVVTLCGHLYCWPCIYNWFDSQKTSNEPPRCPVCKSKISEKTIVPLYGRGQSLTESEGEAIPPRPPAGNIKALDPENQFPSRDLYRNNISNPGMSYGQDSLSPFNFRGTAALSLFHPTAGVFGEMIYAGEFGNSQSPRLRRRELRAEESLNRVTIFLFCVFLLCLLLF